ncbi:hypothetical protein FRC03_008022 [Tulasnella sp. 419]|nr:hypothetical protein FRC02_005758 [Tulasnella sp. 418]KAG8937589.1 hypothetical protein FRC03_008022 [Tulasnella sp. 419]
MWTTAGVGKPIASQCSMVSLSKSSSQVPRPGAPLQIDRMQLSMKLQVSAPVPHYISTLTVTSTRKRCSRYPSIFGIGPTAITSSSSLEEIPISPVAAS